MVPGGLFKGFRTIPVILDIIKDMEELCPDAWLINFTNPRGMVTVLYSVIQTGRSLLAYVMFLLEWFVLQQIYLGRNGSYSY